MQIEKMKRIGIIANVRKELTKGVVEEIITWAGENGFDFLL